MPAESDDFDVEASEAEDPGYDARGDGGMELDWAVSEVVQELHPMKVDLPVSRGSAAGDADFTTDRIVDLHAGEAFQDVHWHYGSHHKSGTDLLRDLASEHSKLMKEPYCFSLGMYGFDPPNCNLKVFNTAKVWQWCNFSAGLIRHLEFGSPMLGDYHSRGRDERVQQSFGKLRGVHIIRDPISMVVSGYIYHMHNDDTPPALKAIRNMSMADGLTREARFVLNQHGKDMVKTYALSAPWVMTVRYEAFTKSSASFDKTAAAVYQHMLGGISTLEQRKLLVEYAAQYDLRRGPPSKIEKSHVSSAAMKAQVRNAIKMIPKEVMAKLKAMRLRLGYWTP